MKKTNLETYYYDEQIKNYMYQFAAIFSELQVAVGRNDNAPDGGLVEVPVKYGNADRVVSAILSDNVQNKPVRLPAIAVNLLSLELAPDLRKGVGSTDRYVYMPLGGDITEDLKSVNRYMPIPYRARVEAAIMTSNIDQMWQILEQVLMLFDPMLQLQLTDNRHDWRMIQTVELDGINPEENYPSGTEPRVILQSLTFNFPIHISPPIDVRNNVIQKIRLRVAATSKGASLSETLAGMDSGDFFETEINSKDFNLPKN